MSSSRDYDVLRRMIRYCDEIDVANADFGNSLEKMQTRSTYKNAVAMCILQIGELTSHLSEVFRDTHPQMPWRDIKRMRNITAHRYGSFDVQTLWDTITDDIPALRQFCVEAISHMEREA